MSTDRKLPKLVRPIVETSRRAMRYVSDAVLRVFSPSDDNYPKTGVQPYSGDPSDDKPT